MLLKNSLFSALLAGFVRSDGYSCSGQLCGHLQESDLISTTLGKVLETARNAVAAANDGNDRFGLQLDIPITNNYGCWCHTGDQYPGPFFLTEAIDSKDDYDEACKAKHMGYDCIVMDAAANNMVCPPTETDYDLRMTPQPDGSFLLECSETIENDWCKRRVCLVDMRFLIRQDTLDDANTFKDLASFGHPGFHDNVGNFDVSTCKAPRDNSGNGEGGKKKNITRVCCGDYPYRVIYDKDNRNNNACCEYDDAAINAAYRFDLKIGQVYNEVMNQCCSDGVQPVGNMC